MRIALIHDWLTGMRGGEKCLEVFCELFPDADVYTLIYAPEKISPAIRHMKIHASWVNSLPMAKTHYRYLLPVFPTAIETFDLGGYDLILSSSHCVAKGAVSGGAPHLSYIHSPMRYVWDMHDLYFGLGAPWSARLGMALCRGYLQRWDQRSAQRVDWFVANSKHVAAKIKKYYGREAEVIYPPVDLDKFRIGAQRENFFLIVSALVPYKNIQTAIAAFDRLRVPLKVVGEGPLRRSLEKQAGASVEFLGWVDDAKLAELYAGCEALIFPGEEDFGIVPLEAQASGRPVIAYREGGVRESVIGIDELDRDGHATGIFFAESTAECLIDAVERYHKIKHRFDPPALRRHASRFSRAAFKARMEHWIGEKLRHGSGRSRKHAETT